ncbi:MAG: NAD(P)H-dependent oxidoreductase [Candidatus Delongbacteria bacterium]
MKVLIINGNPDNNSFCAALADSYRNGAEKKGHEVRLVHLSDLKFDPVLKYGYKKRQELEPDLIRIRKDIADSDHLCFVFPTWWSTYPALFKGFIDRIFLPGFGFKFKKGSPLPEKKFKGKTARILITMDGPAFFYKYFLSKPGINSIKKGLLEFCGVKPVKYTIFASIKSTDEAKRKKMLDKADKLGNAL